MKKKRSSIVFYIVAIAFVIYAGYTFLHLSTFIDKKTTEVDSLKQQIERQTQTNAELENLFNEEIDNDYIERIARNQLGLAYPNERVFYNIDDS